MLISNLRGLALCLSIITLSYGNSPVFGEIIWQTPFQVYDTDRRIERPVQSSIVVCFFCGTLLLFIFVVIPRRILSSASTNGHSHFPFRNGPWPASSSDPPLTQQKATDFLTVRSLTFQIFPAAGAIFLRVELFRLVLGNRQCSLSGTEVRM